MQKRHIVVYSVLVWLRWIASSTPGYVHPDEYFQSPEITAGTVLGVETLTPWEYQPIHAARSIVVPFLTTGLSFLFMQPVDASQQIPETVSIFLAERMPFFALSLLMDFVVYKLCRQLRQEPLLPMVIMATSQVMLVYYMRPFSNTVESLILCLSLLVYSTTFEQTTAAAGFLLGCLISLGIFTRVTFVLYGLPVCLAYLRMLYIQNGKHIGGTVASLIPFAIGASLVSSVCIVADSLYYKALKVTLNGEPFKNSVQVLDTLTDIFQWPSLRFSGHFVLTPLNNLLYNMDVDNLKQHGLHPRYLHLLVNTPMLYGPLAIGALSAVYGKFLEDHRDEFQQFYYVLLGTIVVPLAGLSSMPHQEARFLTPLLVPLVLTYTWNRDKLYRFFWVIWPLFNIIMTFVFGVLHQGGMMPAMMYVQQQSLALQSCETTANGGVSCYYGPLGQLPEVDFDLTTHLLFYKTYMPPEHLLAYPTAWKKDPDCHVHVTVKDFAGRLDLLEQEIAVREGVDLRTERPMVPQIDFAPSGEKTYERTLVISPSTAMLPHVEKRRYQLLASLSPHVNFDDAAMLLQAIQEGKLSRAMMGLNVYLLLSDVD